MNAEKNPGEKWLIMLRQGGGQLDCEEKDEAILTDDGLVMIHGETDKTTTFVPLYSIAWVRAYRPDGRVDSIREQHPLMTRPRTELGQIAELELESPDSHICLRTERECGPSVYHGREYCVCDCLGCSKARVAPPPRELTTSSDSERHICNRIGVYCRSSCDCTCLSCVQSR